MILFVFKQKTADEMRISDWSSDVCSSDLRRFAAQRQDQHVDSLFDRVVDALDDRVRVAILLPASLHDDEVDVRRDALQFGAVEPAFPIALRSEEQTSELQSLMRISYAVFCLKNTQKLAINLTTSFE